METVGGPGRRAVGMHNETREKKEKESTLNQAPLPSKHFARRDWGGSGSYAWMPFPVGLPLHLQTSTVL